MQDKSSTKISDKVIKANPADVIILDGIYSFRPELADLVDLSVLVLIDDKLRHKRLEDREGQDFMRQWHAIWDEAEDHYFTKVRKPSDYDLVIELE